MVRNMNKTDRIVRTAVGVGLVGYAILRKNYWAALGAYPLITGALGACPVYSLMHVSTARTPVERVAAEITEMVS